MTGKLGKKIGPLPAWAWGLLLVAILGWFFLRSRSASAAPAPSVADQQTQATGAAAPSDQGAGSAAAGLDPGLLDGLMSQNSMLTQGLLDGFRTSYGGGSPAAATGYGAAPTAADGASTATGVTGTAAPADTAPADTAPASTGPAPLYSLVPTAYGSDTITSSFAPSQPDSPAQALAGTQAFRFAFGAPVGTTGIATQANAPRASGQTFAADVDPSGHVVNAKGARVGGIVADPN